MKIPVSDVRKLSSEVAGLQIQVGVREVQI